MQDPKLENYQEKARKKFEDLDFGSEFFLYGEPRKHKSKI